jgi:uncharacterized protein YeaO (DUF488 family)
MIIVKRIYASKEAADGTRVLVERLWPRGFTRERAAIDLWLKEIAPSQELRKWYAHDPQKWPEFCKRYQDELKGKKDLLDQLSLLEKGTTLTLLYAAHDEQRNCAVVVKEFLEREGK